MGFVKHRGAFVMEFDDLSRARLKRDSLGRLIVAKYIRPDKTWVTHMGGGQSDYDEQNTAGGLVMAQFSSKGFPKLFQIFNTKVFLPD